jgi:hypothetical protein
MHGPENVKLIDVLFHELHENRYSDTKSEFFNLSNPSGFFTHHEAYHSKILYGARLALSVLYGSQNRERRLLYTSLAGWFL